MIQVHSRFGDLFYSGNELAEMAAFLTSHRLNAIEKSTKLAIDL